MTGCDVNSIEYYKGDNQPIRVIITDQDGNRIENIQTDTTEIEFQAQNQDGSLPVPIDLKLTQSKIDFTVEQNALGEDIDVATVKPSITDTNISSGKYPVFMRFTLQAPTRKFHVSMDLDGVPLKYLIILEGGIS